MNKVGNIKEDCVADTSTLIALARGNVADCLGAIFRKVYIPPAVKKECRDFKTDAAVRKPFFEVREAQNILPLKLHKGELEALSLAVELGVGVILVDDRKAFGKAMEHGLEALSLSDVLILAKQTGSIDSAKKALDAMKASGEGIQDEMYFEILRKTGEM